MRPNIVLHLSLEICHKSAIIGYINTYILYAFLNGAYFSTLICTGNRMGSRKIKD